MASVFRLGKEVILTKEEELEQQLAQEWKSSETTSNIALKDVLKYRLWKMRSIPSSSIPYIEAHLSTPTNSLKYDEIDSIDEYSQESQNFFDNINTVEDNIHHDVYENGNNNESNRKKNNINKNDKNDKNKNEILDFNCRKHFSVKWNVSYILDTDANVSSSIERNYYLI